jgi:hypothetical protein
MLDTGKIEMSLGTTNESLPGAPLEEFAKACNALQKCIEGIARCLGRSCVDAPITNLRYGSAVIEVETDAEIADAFVETVASLEEGRALDDRLDYMTMKAFERFAFSVAKPNIIIGFGAQQLTSRYATNVRAALEHSQSELGSVSGRLEAVNVHGQRTFTLYPPVANERVECQFQQSQITNVLKAVSKHVTVFGTLRYRRGKAFPSRVKVDEFVVNPDDKDLPTLLEPDDVARASKSNRKSTWWDGDDEWE